MRRLFFILMLGLVSLKGFALEEPKGSRFDPRIQQVNYNEKNVVKVNAYSGVATQIVFSEDEEVLDIASGFSEGWELHKRRNHLYLKPKSIKQNDKSFLEPVAGVWNTNVIVTTTLRVYAFQLELQPDRGDHKLGQDEKISFRIAFNYPLEEAKKKNLLIQKEIAQKRLDHSPLPRNWRYFMKIGKRSQGIAPSQAYDDGRFTYLKFPGNREFPAVFIREADRSESLVNTHIDPKHPDVLVVQQVVPQMILRLGKQVVGIVNGQYDAYGNPSTNGTTVQGVKRTIQISQR